MRPRPSLARSQRLDFFPPPQPSTQNKNHQQFKADGKGHGGHVAHKITALIRYFKHESAMRKKERKESGSGSGSPGKAPGVKGGIKKKH